MALPNIYSPEVAEEVISRINRLELATQSMWGKMSAAQMFAHCNVTYEMVYEDKHPKPNPVMKFILKSFIKKSVTGRSLSNITPRQHHS